ncbi:MAG: hypothetical protein V4634_07875 [Pseudomonadota bacterium]
MDLNIPYFLLGFDVREGPATLGQTVVLWELEQLLFHCREILADQTRTLTQVAVMCPNWMTNASGWQMVDISEIQKVQMKKNKPAVVVYITQDGRKLADSRTKLDLKKTISDESVLALSVV